MAERQGGEERHSVPTAQTERSPLHPQGHAGAPHLRHRLREGVLVATLSVATAVTALMFAATTTGLPPATQTVVSPELYEPVTIPHRTTVVDRAIPLGPDEAPRAESPTPTPTPSPTASPRPKPRTTPRPQPEPVVSLETSHSVGGTATWYAAWYMHTGDLVGAAGPLIRVGDWRGRTVQVCSGSSCVNVRLVDWCACGDRGSLPTLIDLSPAAFSALASQSRGVIRVKVSW